MKWNFKRTAAAAAAVNLVLFCTEAVAQEELSSEEIGIIDEIVKTKMKETGVKNARLQIQKAVDKIFPVIEKDTPESSAYIKKLEAQACSKYPATDEELEKQYSRTADQLYPPLYKQGDHVTVAYVLQGKPFTVSGPYHRQDSRFVWVGSKKILKYRLSQDSAARFDAAKANSLRKNYINRNIRLYHQKREELFTSLKAKNGKKIFELRGCLAAYNRRLAAREAAQEKLLVLEKEIKDTYDLSVKMYAKNKQEGYRMMKKMIGKYPGAPEAEKGTKLLAEWEGEIEKEKAEKRRWAEYERHGEEVRRRTGRYPCRACNGTGLASRSFNPRSGFSYRVCNACGGSGLE